MGWNFLSCAHGIIEKLDYHGCGKCRDLAKKLKYDTSNGKTYIFTEETIEILKKEGFEFTKNYLIKDKE